MASVGPRSDDAVSGKTSSGPSNPTYTVQLDNAFGLVSGADVKVAGVRAGTIDSFGLDKNNKALVKIKIWSSVFGLERIGIDDNFIDLGGHSLLAMQIVSRIRSLVSDTLHVGRLL